MTTLSVRASAALFVAALLLGTAATSSPVVAASTIQVYPGQNVQAKIDGAATGSVISMHAGTYSKLRLKSNITLQAAGDGKVIITGATGSWDAGLWIKDAANVTVRGLTVRGNRMGIYLRNATGALIENNVVTDNAYGFEIHANTAGTVIRRNRIVNNDRYFDSGRKAGGMNLFKTYGGIRIANNRILKNDSVGIEIYGASDAVISGNVIAGSADAIETGTDSGGSCEHNRIIRNVIYNAGHRAEERGIWVRCLSRSLIAHNTIYGMDMHAIGITSSGAFSGPISRLRILNNALVHGRGLWMTNGLPSSLRIDYNNIDPCTSGSCPAFGDRVATQGSTNYMTLSALRSGTPYMDHGISVAPRFVDAGHRDFHIRAGSPMIDRGTDLGWRFRGSAPDLGRYEKG